MAPAVDRSNSSPLGPAEMNIQFAFQVINHLSKQGAECFCICPSSRNAPFVEVLARAKGLEIFYFFDERAMAFFALGRAKRDARPAVVVTTSGTAVLELYPAVVEACYALVPLIAVTADRPIEYEGSGAPQCIDQKGVFSKYVQKEVDLQAGKKDLKSLEQLALNFSDWNKKGPIHLNVRFDEPVVNEPCLPAEYHYENQKTITESPLKRLTTNEKNQIQGFFQKSKNPLIILAELSAGVRQKVKNLLLDFNRPIYAEALSGLREDKALQHLMLKSGDSILKKAFKENLLDGVIRLGAVPVCRFWRDLNEMNTTPVLSASAAGFSGLKGKRAEPVFLSSFLEEFFPRAFGGQSGTLLQKETLKDRFLSSLAFQKLDLLFKMEQEELARLENKMRCNRSLSWTRWISKNIPRGSFIFLGNSLPIREWNLAAVREDKGFVYAANRGANGIDGLLSSFFGACSKDRFNICVVGDLSALYDLSSPWVLKQMSEYKLGIIIMNNFGGGIFKEMFEHPAYLNRHNIDFENFAKMWGLNYKKAVKQSQGTLDMESPFLVEICLPPS